LPAAEEHHVGLEHWGPVTFEILFWGAHKGSDLSYYLQKWNSQYHVQSSKADKVFRIQPVARKWVNASPQ
jgi:hypothetical protein